MMLCRVESHKKLANKKRTAMSDYSARPFPEATITIWQFCKRISYLFFFVKGVRLYLKSHTGKPFIKQLEEIKNLALLTQVKTHQSNQPDPLNKF
jgi:hypothetical protein